MHLMNSYVKVYLYKNFKILLSYQEKHKFKVLNNIPNKYFILLSSFICRGAADISKKGDILTPNIKKYTNTLLKINNCVCVTQMSQQITKNKVIENTNG